MAASSFGGQFPHLPIFPPQRDDLRPDCSQQPQYGRRFLSFPEENLHKNDDIFRRNTVIAKYEVVELYIFSERVTNVNSQTPLHITIHGGTNFSKLVMLFYNFQRVRNVFDQSTVDVFKDIWSNGLQNGQPTPKRTLGEGIIRKTIANMCAEYLWDISLLLLLFSDSVPSVPQTDCAHP